MSKMRWINVAGLLTAAAAIIIWTTGCSKGGDSEAAEVSSAKTITIGAILPLTGDAAVWGQNVKNGIELARISLNNESGINNKRIEVIYEDSQGLPRNAVSALQKLIDFHHVPAVIGDVASSAVLAMGPIANRREVVLLSPGASNPEITDAGEFIFRNWHSDAFEGSFLADVAYNTLGMRRVAIIFVNNAYGKGLEEVFSNRFDELGGTIVASEGFEQNATNFRSQLARIKAVDCDGIFMPGYPQEMPEVLKQAKELGMTTQFLCPSAFEDQQILDLAGAAAEGVIYVYPAQGDLSKDHVKKFYREYQRAYGKPPGALSDTGYDALMLLAQAMRTHGTSSHEIRNGLLTIRQYPGVAGDTSFDENGDVKKAFVLKTIKRKQFAEYESPSKP